MLKFLPVRAFAMELKIVGNQLILGGPVVGDEPAKVRDALASSPGVETVILRNSPGGNAPAGYQVGQLLRERGMRTAVSGYCYSSCSRMFLGGSTRYFTDMTSRRTIMSAFTGIMIGQGIWTPIWYADTVYVIGSSNTAMAKPILCW